MGNGKKEKFGTLGKMETEKAKSGKAETRKDVLQKHIL